ncbi:No hit [Brucella canis HSK A52141]|nr:No hit [Brucella canis HSK A52141]
MAAISPMSNNLTIFFGRSRLGIAVDQGLQPGGSEPATFGLYNDFR